MSIRNILQSGIFLQMLKMVGQSIASTSNAKKQTCIRASRVFKFNMLCKWLVIALCFENPCSQKTILDEMSITFCRTFISVGQFVCHSKLLPHTHHTSIIILFSHACWSASVNSRSSPWHMSPSSFQCSYDSSTLVIILVIISD